MVTISTQLGDCKDLSTLYHTLARKAGINTRLVLVNTRDNGENNLRVPSTNFNHCIVQIELDDGPIFQELTSEKLPFGVLPDNVVNSQALVIPNSEDDEVGKELINIPNTSKIEDQLNRTTTIKVSDETVMNVQTKLEARGNMAADYRYYFTGITQEKTKEQIDQIFDTHFENKAKIEDYKLGTLQGREEQFTFEAAVKVEEGMVAIGGLKAIKTPFIEKIFTLDPFPDEERQYPILYWQYEDNEYYQTEVIFELPAGSELVEYPQDMKVVKDYVEYELKAEKISNQKLRLIRTARLKTRNIEANEYADFRETIKKIVKNEENYVVFK